MQSYSPRLSVAHGVAHRFLRDAIEMVRELGAQRTNRVHAMRTDNLYTVELRSMHREAAERVLEHAALQVHGRQAARERARALDRVAHETRDAFDLGQDRRIFRREAAGDAAQHERDAGQLLAEAVVQIVADAVLLAIHGLQDRALE